jgi:hypothetical protein
MEFFVVISGVGSLVLLAVHMLDYFVESKYQMRGQAQLPAPQEAESLRVSHISRRKRQAQFDQAA